MQYVVGVDGGGTKTVAVVMGEDLRVVSSATDGPANYRSVGMGPASANIANAIGKAMRDANSTLSDVSIICMCLAGFDTDLDLPVPQGAMRLLDYTGPALMENDVVGAWAGATEAQAGVVIIAGTGSTGLGMNSHGQLWRTDGWDYILGDSGSGYQIGQAAIRAAMQALDGRGAPTLLARELKNAYGVDNAEAMRRLVDSSTFGKFEIASFAAHVAKAASDGDPTAQRILAHAGEELAVQATTIITRLGMQDDEFPVSTVGSVFKATPWVTDPFHLGLIRVAPRITFRPPVHPPEIGAAILGLRRLREGDVGSWTLGTGRRRIQRSLTVEEVGHL